MIGTPCDDTEQPRPAGRLAEAGAVVERDEDVSPPISHPDAETFWTAMTDGGPLRDLCQGGGTSRARRRRAVPRGR
ncbi:hypothetical protein AB0K12_20500 [Nonomuraea sp. NPDC049419]|uniref:hypothetical protein n=1 Tax=Nonomuraea sp. NPDC049419 TaxID=3155772 RepID=UPI00343E9C6C